ncbi:MAG TPA: DUF1890 family protein [Methanocorpusculum sp.]|nr:DUF1890 family protein [Methanocorpusculum sp.]
MAEALIFIGCPQISVPSPLALYIVDFPRNAGLEPIVAANPSAKQLVKMSDPKRHYITKYHNLEKTFGDLADGAISYPPISLIHNNVALTFTATISTVSHASLMPPIFFGEHAYELADEVKFE